MAGNVEAATEAPPRGEGNIPPVGTPPPGAGTDFAGSTIILQQYGPNLDTPVTELLTAIVGEGVEFGDLPASEIDGGIAPIDVNVDVSGNSVFFEVEEPGSGTFADGEFNGYLVVREPNNTPAIETAIIDESATTLAIDSSDIISLEDGIAVNVAGVNYNQGDTLKLDVSFGDGLTDNPEEGPPATGSNFTGAELQLQFFASDLSTPISDDVEFGIFKFQPS